MRTFFRTSPVRIAASAFALSSVVACASSNKPEPATANEAPAQSEQSKQEAAAAATAVLKTQIHGLVCGPESMFRACLQVPDDAACNAAYDQIFPSCSPDFTKLPDGDDAYWTRVGQELMTCIAGGFTSKFAAVETPEEAQRCVAATEAAKRGG